VAALQFADVGGVRVGRFVLCEVLGAQRREPVVVLTVLTPGEVKASAHRGEKDGRVSYWLQPGSYDQPQFKDAWARIGQGGLEASLMKEEAL
jgi:hypothetical protein